VTIPAFGEADALAVEDRPVPEPAPGEMAIDVAFAGANYAEVAWALVLDGRSAA
jgi:NADPH2:quinone reductase